MENKKADIRTLLKEFLEEFKSQKLEISRQQGALWDDLNSVKEQIIEITGKMKEVDNTLAFLNRTLFGEEQIGFKGIVKTMEELSNNIDNFIKVSNERETKRENTLKNINFLYTFLSSTGFVSIVTLIYKYFFKR